ncbi:zinc finger protein 84-like [Aedes albopictus]|uniref:C2h2-type zn-finger protein n=1 Tax=Aedes albopictus TaxID=7160 RepID=A0ABM1XY79_AEDAL|nr:zinc finger protein 84-like [Aedes albopictus]
MTSETFKIKVETSESIEQVCRLCLGENRLQNIFMKNDVQQWIYNYLSITVSETDTISQLICTDCQTRLEEFHAFKQRCLDAQDVLEGKSFTEIQRNKLKCEFCAKVFPVKQKLINHRKSHKSKKFKCTICGKGFQQPSRVARHMTVHNKTIKSTMADKPNEPNTVLVQSKPVVKYDSLQCNSEVEASPTIDDQEDQIDGQFECDFCDKKFELKKSLMDHRRNVHLPKRHKCSICSKSFITRTRLDQHINIHAGFIPNGDESDVIDPKQAETDANSDPENKQAKTEKEPCSVCKRFIKASSMDGHLNRHKGIKPYQCEMGCPEMKFHCKLQRKSHYHDIHGWRAYECTICHQYFQTGRSCRRHKIKAHGQGHKCTVCHVIYETGAGLEKHIAKTQHNNHAEESSDKQMKQEECQAKEQSMETEDLFEAEDIKVEYQSDDDGEMP